MKFSESAHPAVVFLRMVATLAFVILFVAGIALLAKSASSQSAETQRADVVKLLTDRYGERSVAAGLADNGAVVEVLTALPATTRKGATLAAWKGIPIWDTPEAAALTEYYIDGSHRILHRRR